MLTVWGFQGALSWPNALTKVLFGLRDCRVHAVGAHVKTNAHVGIDQGSSFCLFDDVNGGERLQYATLDPVHVDGLQSLAQTISGMRARLRKETRANEALPMPWLSIPRLSASISTLAHTFDSFYDRGGFQVFLESTYRGLGIQRERLSRLLEEFIPVLLWRAGGHETLCHELLEVVKV